VSNIVKECQIASIKWSCDIGGQGIRSVSEFNVGIRLQALQLYHIPGIVLELCPKSIARPANCNFSRYQMVTLVVGVRHITIPEHLKVTTRRAASIKDPSVAGFLPRRLDLSFTQNLPKPLIRTSSPEARVSFMISI